MGSGNYIKFGAGALAVSLANYSGYRVNCEVHELECRKAPEHPHSPDGEPAHVAYTLTTSTASGPNGPIMPNGSLTLTGSGNDVTVALTGVEARFTQGTVGALTSTATPYAPINTGTMENGDHWS